MYMFSPLQKTQLVIFILFLSFVKAQDSVISATDEDFKITELESPKLAPQGFKSVKTVVLNTPLAPDKIYEIRFWIFGPQLNNRGYSYPLIIFSSDGPSNANEDVFELIDPKGTIPKLEVNPPPSYTSRGYYTYEVRPNQLLKEITIALQIDEGEQTAINIPEDVTVTGVFVKTLPGRSAEKNLKTITKDVSVSETPIQTAEQLAVSELKKLAKKKLISRELIDSKKTYMVRERNITIGLYDHRNIDKDRVTMFLNDEMVIENLELKKKKAFFKLQLQPGENTIVLHAENLGEVSPNTTAINIKNSVIEFTAVLESDLETSQYFTLFYKED